MNFEGIERQAYISCYFQCRVRGFCELMQTIFKFSKNQHNNLIPPDEK